MSDGEGIFKAYVQYQIHGEGDFDNPWFPPSFHLLRFYWSFSANTADCRGGRARSSGKMAELGGVLQLPCTSSTEAR